MNDNNFYAEYDSNDNANTQQQSMTMVEANTALVKAYLWMFLGALITFISAFAFTKLFTFLLLTGDGFGLSIFLFIAIFAFVGEMILAHSINKNALIKENFTKSLLGLIGFAVLTGFTFSSLFLYFENDTLFAVFGVVCVYFLILSLISFIFRKRVHKIQAFAYMGLISLLIVSLLVMLVTLFSNNGTLTNGLFLGVSIFGLLVFSILTIVDVKAMHTLISASYNKNTAAIAAGFTLYLDFINIFIYILRIFMILGRNSRSN